MKTKHLIMMSFVLLTAFILSSCLTCETKEYRFSWDGKGKGTLTIKYINIMSKYDDEEVTKAEQLKTDFNELMNDYANGDKAKEDFPNATFVSSRMFEENGKLCGEVKFEFSSLDQVKLFQSDKKAPYMFLISTFSFETYLSSNGTKGPEYFPIVYWASKMKNFEFATKVDEVDENTTSLLQNWQRAQK